MIVFDNEAKAYEASRALADVHRQGSLTVYSGAVVVKDAGGRVPVRHGGDEGPVGTATGALIRALGSPVGLAAGAVGGSFVDLVNLDEVSRQLNPGKAAIAAELEGEWVTPLDTRMEALGSTIYRRPCTEIIDVRMEGDAALLQAELDRLQGELDQASRAASDAKARIEKRIGEMRADYLVRSDKLRQAWNLTREALATSSSTQRG